MQRLINFELNVPNTEDKEYCLQRDFSSSGVLEVRYAWVCNSLPNEICSPINII